jgi:hypothetical protein
VRGTSTDRPIAGDKGVSATVELSTPELVPGLRLLGFVDAGWLGNNSPTTATKPSSDRLASVGLGLRYGVGAYAVSADYGRLVTGSRVPLSVNSASPQRGDDKLYINLSVASESTRARFALQCGHGRPAPDSPIPQSLTVHEQSRVLELALPTARTSASRSS